MARFGGLLAALIFSYSGYLTGFPVQQVTILEGEAECTVDGVSTVLGPYDTTFIPADRPHRFLNIGKGDLTILWIYGAREVTRTFTETGETVAHLAVGDQV